MSDEEKKIDTDERLAPLERVVRRGDIVTVRKGAEVRTTHPKRDGYILKRSQKVKVYLFLEEWECDGRSHHAEISWAGSGGYWCYAKLSDCA
jgi:hypothetical protein